MDHRELLKKFIWSAGEDSGQCQVLSITEGRYITAALFSEEEKCELLALKDEVSNEH